MKSCKTPPVCSHSAKKCFEGWWIFGAKLHLPQSVWAECLKKRPKLRYVSYKMVPHCLFLATRTQKDKKTTCTCIIRSRTTVKILLGYSTGTIKSSPLEPRFQTSAIMSRCLERPRNCCRLPHCSESTYVFKSLSPGGAFSEQKCGWSCSRVTECRKIPIHR